MTRRGSVGIIANPSSGKDIRRLVAHGSTFDNNEKISIVRRVLTALDALEIERVWFMPDLYGIAPRAAEPLDLDLEMAALPMAMLGNASDSDEAARRLADLGAGAIVTLGGDGTNRVVAKGCGETPVMPISTGTNNVFPRMIEGTLAGMAAGLIASCQVAVTEGCAREPRLDVFLDGEVVDAALIDVVTSRQAWIGARALWEPSHLREIVLSRVSAAEIGICGLGGLAHPEAVGSKLGAHLVVGEGGQRVLTPMAPGLMKRVPIAASTLLEPGDTVDLDASPCTVALDGEREFEILRPGQSLAVRFNPNGPVVIDAAKTIDAGARLGLFDESAVQAK
jgi:predicted polyphosphate/ATP-dependent NAD kinase